MRGQQSMWSRCREIMDKTYKGNRTMSKTKEERIKKLKKIHIWPSVLGLFFILTYLLRKCKIKGIVTCSYLFGYGLIRFILEAFRDEYQTLFIGSFPTFSLLYHTCMHTTTPHMLHFPNRSLRGPFRPKETPSRSSVHQKKHQSVPSDWLVWCDSWPTGEWKSPCDYLASSFLMSSMLSISRAVSML